MTITFDEALAAYRAGDFAGAAEGFQRVSAAVPSNPRPLHNLGLSLRNLGRFAEAEQAFHAALQRKPDFAPYWTALGDLLRLLGRANEALAAYDRALQIDPDQRDATVGKGYVLLGLGRYAEAWPLHEARRGGMGTPVGPPGQEWTQGDLSGQRLLVWKEQGLGDMLMMARYLPLLRDSGAEVVFVCHDALRTLIDRMGVVARPSTFDLSVLAFSLPFRFQTEVSNIPAPARFAATCDRPRGRIGVAWRVQPRGWNAANKALPDALGRELLALPGAVSLHPEDTGARDMQDTANIIAGLDVVVTVDTSVAHLAGSLGKPTWILLPAYGADWRWMQERADSPWYPTARLFRQARPGEWAPVVEEVSRLLA